MKVDGAARHRRSGSSGATLRPADARRHRGFDVVRLSDGQAKASSHDVHIRMVKILPRLRRFVDSLTRGADLSEDLIQETCARALAHLDQWQPGTRLDSWMFRIAQNLWIDHIRAERVRGEVVDVEVIDRLLSCDGPAVVENRIVLRELREDIARLPMDQRDVMRLVCGYGMSYKETGRLLNLPAGTVMSRLARARYALQKRL
ncbi:RNA polymerase sigma factor [Bradyrhizobium sediminis]|uniref:RNA polymerase sigma factor n=1 Tax=Bradyrhizobium sediminis TaxID=2840469 RepID=A0A975RRS6_9BRAD|nr:RNA polymerase sigma factor [Bradyrhizobium sediminis]QWG17309.1 RNA polymerase sigma factor [Bradyrhizobium sediminis]